MTAIAIAGLALCSGSAAGAVYTRDDLCVGFRVIVRQTARADHPDLVVQCPAGGTWRDWLTIKDVKPTCPRPYTLKTAAGDLRITCR